MADDKPLNPGIPEENENDVVEENKPEEPGEESTVVENTESAEAATVSTPEITVDAAPDPQVENTPAEGAATEPATEPAPEDAAPAEAVAAADEGEKAAEGAGEAPAEPAGGEDAEKKAEDAPVEGDEAAAPKPEGEVEGEAPKEEGEAAAATEDGEAAKEGEEAAKEGEKEGEGAEAAKEGEEAAVPEAAEPGEEGVEKEVKTEEAPATEGETEKPSEHFADGERPESPPRVGEKLSREGSPKPEDGQATEAAPEHLPATTPPPDEEPAAATEALPEEGEGEGEEEEEEEEEEEMVFDRELLIEKYRQAHQERQQLMQQNNVLQTKLAEYFRKKKADTEGVGKSEMEKSIADQEQRYLKYIANLEDLRRQYSEFQDDYREQIEDLKILCNDKQEKVDAETAKFMEFKKQTGIKAINSRSGKPIPPRELEGFLGNEHKKESEVVQVRLKNIKLQNQLRKEEMALKSKEELAEGLHLIDFEQLKIENQTYNEKIEERNEELLKLRKKITSTVQILTHLKEKLQFVQQENLIQRNRLNEVDSLVARERDLLTRTKQSRDALRIDNQKLRQNCGLLGNEALLRNFEECVDTVDDKKKRLDMMRMEHAELTLNYNGLKRKIEQAKSTSALGGRL